MTKIELRSEPEVTLVDFMGGDDSVAMSAWISFGSDREERLLDQSKVKGLINFLYRNQHMTPFESSVFTFRVECPIFVSREIFRHRAASYNEWSGRYSEMIPSFYLPDNSRPLVQQGKPGDYHFVPGSDEQYALLVQTQKKVYEHAWKAYQDALRAGIAKEVARNVLPLATYTQFYVTMNARNLMHFLGFRNESHALYEIQGVARAMEDYLAIKMPFTYGAYLEGKNA